MQTLGSIVLNKILENEKLNPNQFAESIGLERTQPIYDIINGKVKKISTNYAKKILAVYPHYSYNWLTTGEGEMLKIKSEVTPKAESDYMMVEYVDLRASAGRLGGADIDLLPETHVRLVPKEYKNGGFLVVRVDGDSMDDGTKRSLCDGDEVLIKEKKDFHVKDLPIKKTVFVITSREGNVLKQIKEINTEEGYIICHSFNPIYPDFKMELSDIYQIFIVCKVVARQISLI
ncbi:MAG: helix-turn-helix transcriptional regulator [Dysgonomonas mossii]|nr:helix-turn-helix transcriptional regulator [Dysgonomonas mossii]